MYGSIPEGLGRHRDCRRLELYCDYNTYLPYGYVLQNPKPQLVNSKP